MTCVTSSTAPVGMSASSTKLAPISAGMADRLNATLPRRVSQVTTTAWKNSDSRFTAISRFANIAARSTSLV